MSSFTIKRGDTSPALQYALLPASITLAQATVRFQMRQSGGRTVIDAPATIVSEEPPIVEYAWQEADTSQDGSFEAEFQVTNFDGTRETFPNRGFIQIQIGEDVPDMV